MKTITYGYITDGYKKVVFSRVGSKVAIPVMDYKSIGEDGNFTGPIRYELEEFGLDALFTAEEVVTTRKVPVLVRNWHREFWEMEPLTTTTYICRKCSKEKRRRIAFAGSIDPRPVCPHCNGVVEEDVKKGMEHS